MSKKFYLAASVCAASLMMASAANAVNVVDIYGTYSESNSSPSVATIDNNGLAQGNASTSSYFTVSNLSDGGAAKDADNDTGGLLFTVDPAGSGNGTETDAIGVTFDFYSSGSSTTPFATLTDSALATFNFNNTTDNICWTGTPTVTGSSSVVTLVSASAVGTCVAPGASGTNGYEKITVDLDGSTYVIDLGDWSDWDESPTISFQLTCNTNCGGNPNGGPVPEPLTLSLFGAGLAGAAALRRRKKKAA